MTAIIINVQERAVSSDINRLQTMSRELLAESQRWQYNAVTSEDEAAGVAVVTTAETAPVSGNIVNGILPRPNIGTFDVTVSPGFLYLADLDSPLNPDIGIYKPIYDQGVPSLGTLVIGVNASGFTRVDVLECARNPNVVTESDVRDIFNSSSGLFTPTNVPKVQQDQLMYRIRAGTPGAGYPGSVSGWLPLMVCAVYTTATSCDGCDFWDVRPLASDLAKQPFDVIESSFMGAGLVRSNSQALPNVYISAGVEPTSYQFFGTSDLILDGRKLGGNLSPFVSFLEANSTQVLENGFAFTGLTQGIWYLYLATFFGLPRWARYTPFTLGVRKPQSPRGMPIFSIKPPINITGRPAMALGMPVAFGMGASTTTDASIAMAGCYDTTSGTPIFGGALMRDGEVLVSGAFVTWNFPTITYTQPVTIVTPTDAFSFELIDNTTHPFNASSVKVAIHVAYQFGAAPIYISGFVEVQVFDQSDGSAAVRPSWTTAIGLGTGGTGNAGNVGNDLYFECDIPLFLNPTNAPATRTVSVLLGQEGGAGAQIDTVNVTLLGFKLQP